MTLKEDSALSPQPSSLKKPVIIWSCLWHGLHFLQKKKKIKKIKDVLFPCQGILLLCSFSSRTEVVNCQTYRCYWVPCLNEHRLVIVQFPVLAVSGCFTAVWMSASRWIPFYSSCYTVLPDCVLVPFAVYVLWHCLRTWGLFATLAPLHSLTPAFIWNYNEFFFFAF